MGPAAAALILPLSAKIASLKPDRDWRLGVLPTKELPTREEDMADMNKADMNKDRVVELLNRILESELAGVIRYTHYSLLVYGFNRIPIVSWLRDQATNPSPTHKWPAR